MVFKCAYKHPPQCYVIRSYLVQVGHEMWVVSCSIVETTVGCTWNCSLLYSFSVTIL